MTLSVRGTSYERVIQSSIFRIKRCQAFRCCCNVTCKQTSAYLPFPSASIQLRPHSLPPPSKFLSSAATSLTPNPTTGTATMAVDAGLGPIINRYMRYKVRIT